MAHMQEVFDALDMTFGKDMTLAFATANDNTPYVRFVDTYYHKGSFYIVSHEDSNKATQVKNNNRVSLCYRLHNIQGKAYNIGHPLDDKNKEIRAILVEVFRDWYFQHNNEKDPKMCFLKVEPEKVFTYYHGYGYRADMTTGEVEKFAFQFDIVPIP